jgi:transposase
MISKCIRAQTVALHEAGLSQLEISKQLGISRCRVQNAIRKFKETGPYDENKRSRRIRKINGRDIRHLKRSVKLENRLSASKITADLNNSLPKLVTTCTVRNYLRKLSDEYAVELKKTMVKCPSSRSRDGVVR